MCYICLDDVASRLFMFFCWMILCGLCINRCVSGYKSKFFLMHLQKELKKKWELSNLSVGDWWTRQTSECKTERQTVWDRKRGVKEEKRHWPRLQLSYSSEGRWRRDGREDDRREGEWEWTARWLVQREECVFTCCPASNRILDLKYKVPQSSTSTWKLWL